MSTLMTSVFVHLHNFPACMRSCRRALFIAHPEIGQIAQLCRRAIIIYGGLHWVCYAQAPRRKQVMVLAIALCAAAESGVCTLVFGYLHRVKHMTDAGNLGHTWACSCCACSLSVLMFIFAILSASTSTDAALPLSCREAGVSSSVTAIVFATKLARKSLERLIRDSFQRSSEEVLIFRHPSIPPWFSAESPQILWMVICQIITLVLIRRAASSRSSRRTSSSTLSSMALPACAQRHGRYHRSRLQEARLALATLFSSSLSGISGLIPGCKTPTGTIPGDLGAANISFIYFNGLGASALAAALASLEVLSSGWASKVMVPDHLVRSSSPLHPLAPRSPSDLAAICSPPHGARHLALASSVFLTCSIQALRSHQRRAVAALVPAVHRHAALRDRWWRSSVAYAFIAVSLAGLRPESPRAPTRNRSRAAPRVAHPGPSRPHPHLRLAFSRPETTIRQVFWGNRLKTTYKGGSRGNCISSLLRFEARRPWPGHHLFRPRHRHRLLRLLRGLPPPVLRWMAVCSTNFIIGRRSGPGPWPHRLVLTP